MSPFASRLWVLTSLWFAIAAGLYLGFRRFPKYRYNELLRDHSAKTDLERLWYYHIPHPVIWLALATAGAAVAWVYRLGSHPEAFSALMVDLSKLQLWLNNIEVDSFFLAPLAPLWSAVVLICLVPLTLNFGLLAVTETIFFFSRDYLTHHHSTALGPYQNIFDKEWRKGHPHQQQENQALLSFLSWAFILLAAVGAAFNQLGTTAAAVACCLIAAVFASYLRRPLTQARVLEIRQRFDSERLASLQRRRLWQSALRGWLICPTLILFLAPAFPFYILDQTGISEHSHGKTIFTPWLRVTGMEIVVMPPLGGDKLKTGRSPEPRLELLLDLRESKKKLNDWGAFDLQPVIVNRLADLLQRSHVPIKCSIDDTARKELDRYLTAELIGYRKLKQLTLLSLSERCETAMR